MFEKIIVDHEIITVTFKDTNTQTIDFTKVCPPYLFRIVPLQNDEYRFVVTTKNKTIYLPFTRGPTEITDNINSQILQHSYSLDLYTMCRLNYKKVLRLSKPTIFSIEIKRNNIDPSNHLSLSFCFSGYNVVRKSDNSCSRLFSLNEKPLNSSNCIDSKKYHNTYDWKMYWSIENNDVNGLISLCSEMKNNDKDVFTNDDAEKIKVYMCGLMEFSALRHAIDINCYKGDEILIDHGIGLSIGLGLKSVDIDKFKTYMKTLKIQSNNTI